MPPVTHIRKLWTSRTEFKAGSVIVITGAASGIGREVAIAYSKRDCNLALLDNDPTGLSETVKLCSVNGIVAKAFPVDTTKEKDVKETFVKLLEQFNEIDIMVLCAGIGAHHLFEDTKDLSIFRTLMEVNFFGYLYCIKEAYPHLMRSAGVLVAITSFSAEVGLPLRSAYCASKFATTGLLESLRSEIAISEKATGRKGFSITIVCPPTVDTSTRKEESPASSNPFMKFRSKSAQEMTVKDCADAIVDATDRRLRKAFFPFKSWLAAYVRPLFPDIVDDMIRKRASL